MQRKVIKLECPGCGAALNMEKNHRAVCPHCDTSYLVDEAEGCLKVDVNVDYGKQEKADKTYKSLYKWLVLFLLMGIGIIAIIWRYNVVAREADLVQWREEPEKEEDGQIMRVFCKDVFGKEYEDITPEEFHSIKYIDFDYVSGTGNEHYVVLYYSLVDYRDCASEAEFQETIQCFTCYETIASGFLDTYMLTGITRIEDPVSVMFFSEEADISYVSIDARDGFDTLKERHRVDPKDVEVLHLTQVNHMEQLEGLQEFTNLKELYLEGNVSAFEDKGGTFDLSKVTCCKNLEVLSIDCHTNGYTNIDALGELTSLKSFYVKDLTLAECDFFHKMTNLEEVNIEAGENGDYSQLCNLPKLKTLWIMGEGLLSAQEIACLQNVERLCLDIDTEEALQVLAKLPKLKRLHVTTIGTEENGWSEKPLDISVISELVQVEDLVILGNTYVGAEPLLNHPTLTSLCMDTCYVNMDLLQVNNILKELDISGNPMHDATTGEVIEPKELLKFYPEVEVLSLNNCKLVNINFLEECENLRICHLRNNKIVDFSPLDQCKKLELLYIYDNPYEVLPSSEEVKVYVDSVVLGDDRIQSKWEEGPLIDE